MRYLQSDFLQPLLQWQTEIDQALAAFIKTQLASLRRVGNLLEELVTLRPLRQRLEWVYGDRHRAGSYQEESPTAQALMDLLDQALRAGKKSVESWGGTLYFVYLPDRARYAHPTHAMSAQEQVLRIVRNIGMLLIDLDNAFRAQPDPLAFFPFRRLGHYNEAGHRLVAEKVLRAITFGN